MCSLTFKRKLKRKWRVKSCSVGDNGYVPVGLYGPEVVSGLMGKLVEGVKEEPVYGSYIASMVQRPGHA